MAKRKSETRDAEADQTTAKATKEPVTKLPNVKLANGPGEVEPLGAGPVTVGMKVLGDLPAADAQRAGFYFPEARQLVRLFPGRFRLIIDKVRKET